MTCDSLALHTDKYQINMMYAHWKKGTHNNVRVFDLFFRDLPFGNGYAVFAGLERMVNYINSLRFSEEDIAYLAQQKENYDPKFLDELRRFRFTGNIRAVGEGTLVFPNEPIIQVEARNFENKLVETALLNFMYQTLVATKAARAKSAAPHLAFLEFGTRRAHETNAAVWGARATYIAGFDATSNMQAGKMFGIPASGTHSHAWVQDYDRELDAFMGFVDVFPDTAILLVDTYDTLKSGVPNAIRTAKYLEEKGSKLNGIRIDSGDLAYLSKRARKMLDAAGLDYVKIVASSDLDEHKVTSLVAQGAMIDIYALGTRVITCVDSPALGSVYKLVAKKNGSEYIPSLKISGNPEKITTPGFKKLYRLINKSTGKAEGDYIANFDEDLRATDRIKLFDPVHTWIYKFITNFEAVELLQPVFVNGKQVHNLPPLAHIRSHYNDQRSQFWPEYLRLLNPEIYPVGLSKQVWKIKQKLIAKYVDNKENKL